MDKWLFHARFYRTRALAQAAASAGKVRLNGVRVDKPAHAIKPGDILTLGLGGADHGGQGPGVGGTARAGPGGARRSTKSSRIERIRHDCGPPALGEPVRPLFAPEPAMTYVVTEACIKCKFMDCVEVCPVDCFYEGENMLVINPDECIDCGVCEPECPPEAIKADTESGLEKWLSVNAEYAKTWPNISQKGEPAGRRQGNGGVPDKFEKFFSQARVRVPDRRTFPA